MSDQMREVMVWVGLTVCLALAGCQGAVWDEPTLVPLPTLTPSPVFTPTPPIAPATVSPIPPTVTPHLSPTALIGPTATRGHGTPGTVPSPGVLTGGPAIDYFVATPNELDPGQTALLLWSSSGGVSAAVYRLTPEGERGRSWAVPLQGSLAVSVQARGGEETYVLAVTDGASTVERRATLTVTCVGAWLYPDPPEDAGCPQTEALSSLGTTQVFERGQMVWIEATDEIVVLFADGGEPAWLVMLDPYTEGAPEADSSIQPPAGLTQPIRGFGTVWRETPGVQDRLGWALGEETSYTLTFQRGDSVFLTLPDGRVLYLGPEGNRWEVFEPVAAQE